MLPETKTVLEQITEELQPTDCVNEQLMLPRVTDQLGTLGERNHFLEIVHCDRDDQVWSLLHLGSRNIGNRIAQHFLLKKQGVDTKKLNGINYMPIESQEGQDYLRDIEWAQQ
jgi:tRNA-splicing ligase RtcB